MFMSLPISQPMPNEAQQALGNNLNYAKDGAAKFEVPKEDKDISPFTKSIEDPFAIKADPNTHPEGDWSKIPFHEHNNVDQPYIEFKYIAGFIQTLPGNGPPTHIPKNMYDQILLVINAGVPELWVYDITNKTWRKFT